MAVDIVKQEGQENPDTNAVVNPTESEQPDKSSMLLEGQEVTEEVEGGGGDGGEGGGGGEESKEKQIPEGGEAGQEEQAEGQAKVSEFVSRLNEMGWDGNDEDAAKEALLRSFETQTEQYQRLQERFGEQEELAQYGSRFLREQREQEEAATAAAKPASEAAEPPWWNPPKFDQSTLEQYRDVTIGSGGEPQVGWKKGTPKEIVQSAEDYQQYLERWATDLVQRPQEVLPKVIEQEFNRLFEERIAERDSVAYVSDFARQVKETNSDWMYETNRSGKEVLTHEGEKMTAILSEIGDAGVSDPRIQWELAVARYDYMNRSRERPTEEPVETARDVAARKRQEHQKSVVGGTQNRAGTVPRPDEQAIEPQNKNLTPGQQVLQQMRDDGADI